MRPRIAITMGDPAGVGPEVIVKGLSRAGVPGGAELLIVGSWVVIERVARTHAPDLRLVRLESAAEAPRRRGGEVAVLDVGSPEDVAVLPGKPDARTFLLAGRAVETAATLALEGRVAAVVTGPLTKRAFAEIGSPHHGHTEYLAWRCGIERFAMLFVQDDQRIVLATTHLPLSRVAGALSRERIETCVHLLVSALREDFGIDRPRVGVAGLNPHAGEGGLLGEEEETVIRPAVDGLAEQGLEVSGPHPADTLFWHARRGDFDGVVAMYHDQALIPVKLSGPERAVNVTLGLPFVRTSVSHGTGFDVAGEDRAEETSLAEAVNLAARMVVGRRTRT